MELYSRRDLRARGIADGEVRSRRRCGSITPVRRGFYVDTRAMDVADDRQRHLWSVRAALDASSGLVASHASAAVVHGFETWQRADTRVHLTANQRTGARSTSLRVVHASLLDGADITTVDGILVTSAARTIVDLACSWSFEQAVCVGDSALRTTSITEVREVLARSAGQRGIDTARRAVAFMDPRAESVGESRSRVYLHRHGFAAPRLQPTLLDGHGRFLARPDFEIDGVLGEFDGARKSTEYGDAADMVMAEKVREDRLREHGWPIVRWGWRDLETAALAERLRDAIVRARDQPAPRTITVY